MNANAGVEISIERTDGPFGPTNWQVGTSYTDQTGYIYRRFYAPIVPGVGGVVAGTYRIKARITGQPDTEVSVEAVLQYGVFQAYPPQKVLREPTAKVGLFLVDLAPRAPGDPACTGCIRMEGKRESQ